MTTADERVAALAEALERLAPQTQTFGWDAVRLLIEARMLVQRFLQRPGVGRDEVEIFVRRVDELLAP